VRIHRAPTDEKYFGQTVFTIRSKIQEVIALIRVVALRYWDSRQMAPSGVLAVTLSPTRLVFV